MSTVYTFDRRQLSKPNRDRWCKSLREGYFMPRYAGSGFYRVTITEGDRNDCFTIPDEFLFLFAQDELDLDQIADLIEDGVLVT